MLPFQISCPLKIGTFFFLLFYIWYRIWKNRWEMDVIMVHHGEGMAFQTSDFDMENLS